MFVRKICFLTIYSLESSRFQFTINQSLSFTASQFEMQDSGEITELLVAWKGGDEQALEQILPLVEAQLRRIAHNYMRRENPNHTLQTTALINEAYLKLVRSPLDVNWQNRAHFFAVAAQIMRRILLNYARDQKAGKRGGGNFDRVDLEEAEILSPAKSAELLALDEALHELEKFDPVKSRIVELRYFGGLTLQETAAVLGIGQSTVSLHWRMARAWLEAELSRDLPSSP